MGLSTIHREIPGGVVAVLDERVVFMIRQGPLAVGALEAFEREARRVIALAGDLRKGALAVVPSNAGLSKNDLLERQRALMRELSQHRGALAMVVLGDGVHAMMMRAAVRVMFVADGSRHLSNSVADGAHWLGGALGMDGAAIAAAVAETVRSSGAVLS